MLPNIRLAFESNNTIGSWSSPETSSLNRGGWNADGSAKSDVFDDGTAIWGNPSTKKTGIDWTEKELLTNPPQATSNSEKRTQKPEPIISSINGTEAWGAPAGGALQTQIKSSSSLSPPTSSSSSSSSSLTSSILANNSQQQILKQQLNNDNSGNTYGSKLSAANDGIPFSWGESSSLQAATKNENSSPPSNPVWNTTNQIDNIGKQKSSGWLNSSSPPASSSSMTNSARIDELNKQLEATSLFDANSSSYASTLAKSLLSSSASSSSPPLQQHQHQQPQLTATSGASQTPSASSSSNNPNLENQPSSGVGMNMSGNNGNMGASGFGTIGAGGVGGGALGGNNNHAINDLKQQMGANFSTNDLLDSPNRQSASGLSASNNSQSQNNNSYGPYPLGVTPSRDLLKQMVHQIQLAVQAGHLNAHILNQPMSTPTLQLVYHLLKQIKLLQQYQEIQQRSVNKSSDINSPSNLELQIQRVQYNISILQTAITRQQAALTKPNRPFGDSDQQQQQQAAAAAAAAAASANNYSYATISKLSTNTKVPLNNMSDIINNSSNIDSFRRSSLIDNLAGSSNSDSLRSAQANFEANATIDKNMSPLLKASSNGAVGGGNILKGDFTKAFNSNDANQQQQQQQQQQVLKSGLLSAQATSSAWMAFNNSSDFGPQGWPSRISSSNVSQQQDQQQHQQQQQQFNADLLSEFGNQKVWRSSSLLSSDNDKDNNLVASIAGVAAPGANINHLNRPNAASTSNNMKQMSENDFLNSRDASSSSCYDWSNNSSDNNSNNSGSGSNNNNNKRNLEAASSFSSSGGLSLQSNPWLFAPTSSPMTIGSGLVENLIGKAGNVGHSNNGKLDNSDNKFSGDSLGAGGGGGGGYLRSGIHHNHNHHQHPGDSIQNPSASLYHGWGDLGGGSSSAGSSSLQFNMDDSSSGSKKTTSTNLSGGTSGSIGGRPAPPPGLMSNFGPIIGNSTSTNGISSSNSNSKLSMSNDESHMVSRESSSSLWSGAWFD